MSQRDPNRYTQDEVDLPVEIVGSWAEDKLKLLSAYVFISGGARQKFLQTGAAFIDPFCGPGRSQIRGKSTFIDGSPVVAFKRAIESAGNFTSINISDNDPELLAAATTRLSQIGAPVSAFQGPANEAISKIVNELNPNGLHLAFLDPYNLASLSFSLFEALSKLKRIDVIAHVSIADLQRNADRYTGQDYEQFDVFAPGWRSQVNTDVSKKAFRAAILTYWTKKILELGLPQSKQFELISGDQGQRLYWLILLSRHELAHNFWQKISSEAKSPKFNF
jgi:three-Cys-motif partner protein